jgi:hypothetical protein
MRTLDRHMRIRDSFALEKAFDELHALKHLLFLETFASWHVHSLVSIYNALNALIRLRSGNSRQAGVTKVTCSISLTTQLEFH